MVYMDNVSEACKRLVPLNELRTSGPQGVDSMAYVRRHGNQVAIVCGERDKETGKVEQRVLFTLYSREEAREALGEGSEGGAYEFQSLLDMRHPGVSFIWKRIAKGIRRHLAYLPESYPLAEERPRVEFRTDLCSFARRVILSDPQHLAASAELLRRHKYELEFLAEILRWRLDTCDQKEDEWNRDNKFSWRYELQHWGAPPDVEEMAEEYLTKGDLPRAEASFRLLVECFPEYADGYNYLGEIAFEQGRRDDAIAHYRRAVEVGAGLFPKRLAKKHYWRELTTRPYMRGLRNLAWALNEAGKREEALCLCDRQERQCGDDVSAACMRGLVHLNLGNWRQALEAALHVNKLLPSESFIAAYALCELGEQHEALCWFLHGTLNRPRAALLLAGKRSVAPKSFDEVEGHNAGIYFLRSLRTYFGSRRARGPRFLRKLVAKREVAKLIASAEDIVRQWERERCTDSRDAFDRMMAMKTPEYARARAAELAPRLLGTKGDVR